MIKEYYNFFKNYLKVTQIKKSHFIGLLLTSIGYKIFLILSTLFASRIISYLTINDIEMTYLSLFFLIISYSMYKLLEFINIRIYGKSMKSYFNSLQTRIFNKLLTIDDNFTRKISKGNLLNSVNSDIINIGDLNDVFPELITIPIQVIIICIIVLINNVYSGILISIFSILYVLIRNLLDRKSSVYYKKQKKEADKYSTLFQEILAGHQEIKTFNIFSEINKNLGEIKKQYSDSYIKKRTYITARDNDIRFLTHAFKITLYIILLMLMLSKKIKIDLLVLIIGYFETTVTYLNKLIDSSSQIREASISIDRINSILNYKTSYQDNYGSNNNDNIIGHIEFKNVKFSHDKREILKGISFKIPEKSLTAIVGQSGSGKTTIINLLLRLYKPSTGKISIDGVDIYDYSKEVYKSNVGVVNQKPFIFNMSIRNNLSLVDDNINNQIEACKKVGIHDFIESLPEAYNTILRENGTNISGGQKQLISIARTLLSKSEILLFDDITSSLDPDTSLNINSILEELKKEHTVILITHKPELMKLADRIIVLNDGKIVGEGNHKYLLETNKYYRYLSAQKSASKIGVFDSD